MTNYEEYTRAIGAAIRELRGETTQKSLAQLAGTTIPTISGLERGARAISLPMFLRLCDTLEAWPSEVMELAEQYLEKQK